MKREEQAYKEGKNNNKTQSQMKGRTG